MNSKFNATLLVVWVLSGSLPVLAEQSTPSGVVLANNCTGCHGYEGASQGPSIPSIGGLTKEYFLGVMQAYRDGNAYSTIMGRIVKGYSNSEINAMADYYAAKPFVKAKQKFDSKLIESGKKLHNANCETCHENGGAESTDSGVLAGQWLPYLEWTIADFSTGKREVTKKMLKKLEQVSSPAEKNGLRSILNYYAAQNK